MSSPAPRPSRPFVTPARVSPTPGASVEEGQGFAPGTLIVCALLGMLAGLLGSFVQAYRWWGQPFGVYAALLGSAVVFFACGWAASHRVGALCAGVTWLIAVLGLWAVPRPEGDAIFLTNWAGEAWLYGGPLIALLFAMLPYDLVGYRAMVRAGLLEPDPHG